MCTEAIAVTINQSSNPFAKAYRADRATLTMITNTIKLADSVSDKASKLWLERLQTKYNKQLDEDEHMFVSWIDKVYNLDQLEWQQAKTSTAQAKKDLEEVREEYNKLAALKANLIRLGLSKGI